MLLTNNLFSIQISFFILYYVRYKHWAKLYQKKGTIHKFKKANFDKIFNLTLKYYN